MVEHRRKNAQLISRELAGAPAKEMMEINHIHEPHSGGVYKSTVARNTERGGWIEFVA